MAFGIVGTPQTFGFADGSTGHVCTNSDGAPSVGDHDILCVNSDTTVSTPAGFTARVSAVTNQGAYVFTRKAAGGESASVTITTAGNFNAHVIWTRISGGNTVDVTGSAQTNGAAGGTSTPAFTSSALAATGELGLAFGALHSLNGPAVPTSPVWGSSYTALTGGSQGGVSASGVAGFAAYKTPVGTAAESPSLSFTNGASDRYILFISITAAAGGSTLNGDATETVTATISPTAAVTRLASATETVTATISPTAAVDRAAQSSLSVSATVAPTAAVIRPADASLTATATITVSASVVANATASLTVTAAITAESSQPDVNATSTAALAAGRTSITATTAIYTSTAALAAGRTSTAAVSEG